MGFSSFRHFSYLGKIALDVSTSISLSNATILDTTAPGSLVGTLSVVGGTGTYTYTLLSNPGGYFAISGSNLNTALAVTAGIYPITIQADNGAGSVIIGTFTITVTHAGYVPTYFIYGF